MRHSGKFLAGVLFVACAARGGALWVWSDHLNQDRDVYLALADGIAAGRGFSAPGSTVPTAYRPPLYPLLLVITGAHDSAAGRGLLHLLLGTGTVWMTYRLGRRLHLAESRALLAAALVAVDPLLVRYTTFPMTETFVTFLATALLWAIASKRSPHHDALTGLLFGLAVLTRPTFWAFGGLMLLRWIVHQVERTWRDRDGSAGVGRPMPWLTLAVLAATVMPWMIRNWLVMGHPILMTTHGGYTLLLGNNPAYYREVVTQPWGTVWDGSVGDGQANWVQTVIQQMEEAGVTGEVPQDRWMASRARENIRAEPALFFRACLLRLRRFWGITPAGAEGSALPVGLRRLLAAFYGTVFVLAAIGLGRALGHHRAAWLPSILLLAAFVAAHLLYWSDTRMRAPVVPVIALLAARGTTGRSQGPTPV